MSKTARTLTGMAVVWTLLLPLAGAADQGAPPPQPAVGDVIRPFDAQSVNGGSTHVAFGKDSVTVLLFFLSSCPTCHKMIPEWNALYPRRPKNVRVIGVLMDQEPPGFFETMPMAFPVVRAPSRDWLKGYKVNQAPTMVRVGPGGKVEDVTVGGVDRMRVGEMLRP
jgi:thiol-disulfide isomerase/thioredoxin